jgi:hypothetical protein
MLSLFQIPIHGKCSPQMITTRINKTAVRAGLTAGAVCLASVLAAGAANAAPADDRFLAALAHQGIGFGSTQSAITVAHHVCDALAGGMEPADISHNLAASNSGIDQQAGLVITVVAAQSYCPRFVHQMANGATVVGPDH